MTNLSPAAQAVVNAAVEAGGKYGRATPVLHARLAAALRAVAEHLSYQLPFEDFGRIDVIDLLAIADELEALSND
jgi:hypothetical protein